MTDERPVGETFAASVAAVTADVAEGLAPVYEAAAGLRQRLEADGWSPTAAEQLAAHAATQQVDLIFLKMRKDLS